MGMTTPTDEQVRAYIDSVPGLRAEWGITTSKRLGTVAFALMNVLLLAIIVGTIAYFMFVPADVSGKGVSGLIIVLVLAYAVSALRIFQLRAERAELPSYRAALARRLTGDPQTDPEAQAQVDAEFKWESLKYRNIARMIGLAGFLVLAINTYQVGTNDFARVLLFDGAILVFLAGAFWNNFALKADILEVVLEERSRATMVWQAEHREEQPDDTWPDEA